MSRNQFISFDGRNHYLGFVVQGLGGSVNQCFVGGEPLRDFLGRLETRMAQVQAELNDAWATLDKRGRDPHPINESIIRKFIVKGFWAYTVALKLLPFQRNCMNGPTNPLRVLFIDGLEEIYTKCFAAIHIYGSGELRDVGLWGLVTDFHTNGGVDLRTGRAESNNFDLSMHLYFVAYFFPDKGEEVYKPFGELFGAISALAIEYYPRLAKDLASYLSGLAQNQRLGLVSGNSSPAKVALLKQLDEIRCLLLATEAEAPSRLA